VCRNAEKDVTSGLSMLLCDDTAVAVFMYVGAVHITPWREPDDDGRRSCELFGELFLCDSRA